MSRGGKREGAGRKKKADAKVMLPIRLLPSTMENIKVLQEKGVNIAALIDEAVKEYIFTL